MKDDTCNIKTQKLTGTNPQQVHRTVDEMKRLALRDSTSKEIRKIADEIFAKCDNDEYCMAEAAYDYVEKKIKYQFDDLNAKNYLSGDTSDVEFVASPKCILQKENYQVGDCDDMATLLCSIYTALGMRSRMRIIAWKNSDFSHVYAEAGVHINGKGWWIPSDPVIHKFGMEKGDIINAESFEVV
jgi:transglutaminase-like putative cysteine protease